MKKNKKKFIKEYSVCIGLKYTYEFFVKANNKSEAKKKAFMKFKNHVPKKDFDIDADLR
jgi:hypothetical protein